MSGLFIDPGLIVMGVYTPFRDRDRVSESSTPFFCITWGALFACQFVQNMGLVFFSGSLGKYLGSFFSFFRNFDFLGFLGPSEIEKMGKKIFLDL